MGNPHRALSAVSDAEFTVRWQGAFSALPENCPPRSQTHKYNMCSSNFTAAPSGKQEGSLMDRTRNHLLDLLSQKPLFLLAHLCKGQCNGSNYIHGSSLQQGTLTAGTDHPGGGAGGSCLMGCGGWREACFLSTSLKAGSQHLPISKMPPKRLHAEHFHPSCGHCWTIIFFPPEFVASAFQYIKFTWGLSEHSTGMGGWWMRLAEKGEERMEGIKIKCPHLIKS